MITINIQPQELGISQLPTPRTLTAVMQPAGMGQ
jgi:hypothetical protein